MNNNEWKNHVYLSLHPSNIDVTFHIAFVSLLMDSLFRTLASSLFMLAVLLPLENDIGFQTSSFLFSISILISATSNHLTIIKSAFTQNRK